MKLVLALMISKKYTKLKGNNSRILSPYDDVTNAYAAADFFLFSVTKLLKIITFSPCPELLGRVEKNDFQKR